MKKFFTVMCMVSAMAVSGCAADGIWTPMSAGRTAGDGVIMQSSPHAQHVNRGSADATFNRSLRK